MAPGKKKKAISQYVITVNLRYEGTQKSADKTLSLLRMLAYTLCAKNGDGGDINELVAGSMVKVPKKKRNAE